MYEIIWTSSCRWDRALLVCRALLVEHCYCSVDLRHAIYFAYHLIPQ